MWHRVNSLPVNQPTVSTVHVNIITTKWQWRDWMVPNLTAGWRDSRHQNHFHLSVAEVRSLDHHHRQLLDLDLRLSQKQCSLILSTTHTHTHTHSIIMMFFRSIWVRWLPTSIVFCLFQRRASFRNRAKILILISLFTSPDGLGKCKRHWRHIALS